MTNKRAIRAAAVVATFLLPLGGIGLANAAVANAAGVTKVCTSTVKSDFNGDGHADVAVAQENADPDGDDNPSAVRILYGSATGVSKTNNQYLDGSELGAAYTPAVDDEFGISLSTGDFNGDGCADLAVGSLGENAAANDAVHALRAHQALKAKRALRADASTAAYDGAVVIYYGSPTGLQTSNATVIRTASVVPSDADNTLFGMSSAAGDFDGDGFSDLVVGAPLNSTGRGGVGVLYGSASGLSATRHQWFTQATTSVVGTAEAGDFFGFSVAAGDFNGDGKADIAVGAPFQTVGSVTDGGSVTALKGSASGITATGSQQWTQNSTSVPGTAENEDSFGWALAAGHITSKTHADLIVGTPDEGIGSADEAGDITLLKGSTSSILTGSGSQSFDQNSSGVPGTAEEFDGFGASVSVGDLNGDGYGDVAIGVPGEAIGSLDAAGQINVIYGRSTGLTGTGSQGWTQNSTGISGASEAGDSMGATVSVLNVTSSSHADVVIGTPGEDSSSLTDNGLINVILGTKSSTGLTATGNQGIDATGMVNGPIDGGALGASLVN